jgi:nitroimidazol reductase NimA-like FMN-containing flavoprotein (pyridoxamine 5'-phosphate oxidase superfamily)
MSSVDRRALELFRRPLLGHLGFVGLDGYPRVIPIWFVYREGEVLMASRPGEYKGRSLRAAGRASLTAATPEPPYLIASVVGDASVEVLPEQERIAFISEVARRYLGDGRAAAYLERWGKGGHPGDGELIRIRPRQIRFSTS